MGLTGVQRSKGSSVIKEATVIGHAVLQVVVVEGVGRRRLDIGRVVAGPALLDWAAVGTTGPAGPVQGRLQSRVLCVVLGHAPKLRADHAALGPRNRSPIYGGSAEDWKREELQGKQEREEEGKAICHSLPQRERERE